MRAQSRYAEEKQKILVSIETIGDNLQRESQRKGFGWGKKKF